MALPQVRVIRQVLVDLKVFNDPMILGRSCFAAALVWLKARVLFIFHASDSRPLNSDCLRGEYLIQTNPFAHLFPPLPLLGLLSDVRHLRGDV